jgi:hypothetical protein
MMAFRNHTANEGHLKVRLHSGDGTGSEDPACGRQAAHYGDDERPALRRHPRARHEEKSDERREIPGAQGALGMTELVLRAAGYSILLIRAWRRTRRA